MYRMLCLAALLASLTCGPSLAGAASDDDPLKPISPVAQVKIADFRNYGSGGNFTLSRDGKTLASAMNNFLALYDLTSPTHASQARHLALGNLYFMESPIAFSADGKLLVTFAAQHQQDPTVHFFDVQSGKEVRQLDNDQQFFGLTFSADGKILALGGQQQVELWDAVSGDEIRILAGDQNTVYRALAFAPDGKMLAAAGSSAIQLWETATGKERCRLQVDVDLTENRRFFAPGGQSPIAALAFARDGKMLAAGCADSTIRLWDIRTGQEQPPLSGHLAAVCALAFTADGQRLVSFDLDGLKLAWSVRALERPRVDKLPRLSDAEFEEAWNDLADADAFHIYRAVHYLAADPARTLALLDRHLRPVPPGDAKRLEQLVADLQSPKGGVRRKAMAALRKEGEAGLGTLVRAAQQGQGNPNNVAFNARMAAFRGGQPGATGTLIRKLEEQCASPERARAVKAVQVLEQIDNGQARELLQKLSGGAAGAKLTVAASAALERLTARKNSRKTALDPSTGEHTLSSRDLDGLWASLASPEAAPAFQAMRLLWTHPSQSVAILQDRVRPSAGPDLNQIPKLIANLDNDRFAEREGATKALSSFGKLAEPALRQSLAHAPSPESRRRIEQLLEKCDQPVPDAETLRSLRAIEVLEQLRTPEAHQVLEKLTKGAPSSEVTKEAQAALERMAQQK